MTDKIERSAAWQSRVAEDCPNCKQPDAACSCSEMQREMARTDDIVSGLRAEVKRLRAELASVDRLRYGIEAAIGQLESADPDPAHALACLRDVMRRPPKSSTASNSSAACAQETREVIHTLNGVECRVTNMKPMLDEMREALWEHTPASRAQPELAIRMPTPEEVRAHAAEPEKRDPAFKTKRKRPHPFSASPSGLCENCHERPADSWWIGERSTFEVARNGVADMWCAICCLEGQIKHAQAESDRLSSLIRAHAAALGRVAGQRTDSEEK